MTSNHVKERIALRHWLLGRGWFLAAEAMSFAEGYHQGLRKDGVTPEFAHQIQISLYLTTLAPHLMHPEATIATAFLHDVCEDYDVPFAEITARFGTLVGDATHALTKVHKGIKRNPAEVKAAQEACPIASVVKGADRIHNQSTMVGVFGAAKIREYLAETDEMILPMLKNARRAFPSQDGAYQNERTVLGAQSRMLNHFASTDAA